LARFDQFDSQDEGDGGRDLTETLSVEAVGVAA
jgi:hypothetical protein